VILKNKVDLKTNPSKAVKSKVSHNGNKTIFEALKSILKKIAKLFGTHSKYTIS
jgi:hypothetical protein